MYTFIGIIVAIILYPSIKLGFKELTMDIVMYIIVPLILIINKIINKFKKK